MGDVERLSNNSGNEGICPECITGCVAHCELWLGRQPIVGCGGWVPGVAITSIWIGYHVAELAVIRLGWQNRGLGGGSPQKLLDPQNCGGRQDWLGHGVTPTFPIIFHCLEGLAIATYIPTPQAAPTCIQKSCSIPTSLNVGSSDCGVESDCDS